MLSLVLLFCHLRKYSVKSGFVISGNIVLSLVLSSQEMVNKLKEFAKLPDHADMDACFVCLLSHGEEGFIFGTDGKRIPLEEIFMLFGNTNCKGLIGKPKVFIIQACRGGEFLTRVPEHLLVNFKSKKECHLKYKFLLFGLSRFFQFQGHAF